MEPTELYRQIFGIEQPWIVSEVRLDAEASELHVSVTHRSNTRLTCPECGNQCAGYDFSPRSKRQAHSRTKALAESLNARIQELRSRAHGYSNRERFREAIFFETGLLDLCSRHVGSTKSTS